MNLSKLHEVLNAAKPKQTEHPDLSDRVNDKFKQVTAYHANEDDLASLYRIIHSTNRTTILEFGCGWSSLVFALAMSELANKHSNLENYRRNNPFLCVSLDSMESYIATARQRITDELSKHIEFKHSTVEMTQWNGRIATQYTQLPLVNPDFIYLDAPDQFNVEGDINGWKTKHKDMMPMSCDLLKIEHFLTPKTIIVVDGRAANARFLMSNFQRNWAYQYCEKRDQHFFVLEEAPLGKYSKRIIDQHYCANGEWTVDDL